ncbi:MAG: universal stress protein, partial [Planctomycetota bacterium]
ERAEEYALEIAQSMGASVKVVHVIEEIDLENDQEVERFYAALQEQAGKRLAKILTRFRNAGVECDGQIDIGRRWRGVLDAAKADASDLVVVGARRWDDEGRAYLGTTSQRVFLSSPIPVMVIPTVHAAD